LSLNSSELRVGVSEILVTMRAPTKPIVGDTFRWVVWMGCPPLTRNQRNTKKGSEEIETLRRVQKHKPF